MKNPTRRNTPTITPKKEATAAIRNLLQEAKQAHCKATQIQRFLAHNYIPQKKQLVFHGMARICDLEDAPVDLGFGGARGGAKSHTVMAQVALDDCQRVNDLKVLFLRKAGKTAKESLEDLRKKIFLHVPHKYNRKEGKVIFTQTQSLIIVGHFQNEKDVDQYLGIEYDIIVIEEATQLSQSKITLLKGSLRTSKPNWRPRIYYTTNPGGVGHQWFKNLFVTPWKAGLQRKKSPTYFIQATYKDNQYINKGYIKWLESLTGTLARMWRDGDWEVGAGMFFTEWEAANIVIPPLTELYFDNEVWLSFDYGYAHNTAVYWHTAVRNKIITFAEHVKNRWLPAQHAQAIKEISAIYDLKPEFLTIYAGHDCFAHGRDKEGKTIAEQYEENQIYLSRAYIDRVAGAAEIRRMLGNLKAGVSPTWQITENCHRLIECIPAMQVNPLSPEDVLKVNAAEDGANGDDPYDSVRYAHATKRRLGRHEGNFSARP